MHVRHELEEYHVRYVVIHQIDTHDFGSISQIFNNIFLLLNFIAGMMPIRDPEMIHINSSPEAPPPRIRILDTRSREVETVRIGDRLTFRIEIPEDSKSLVL